MKDGKKYILVADDDREIREIVTLLLSSEGQAGRYRGGFTY